MISDKRDALPKAEEDEAQFLDLKWQFHFFLLHICTYMHTKKKIGLRGLFLYAIQLEMHIYGLELMLLSVCAVFVQLSGDVVKVRPTQCLRAGQPSCTGSFRAVHLTRTRASRLCLTWGDPVSPHLHLTCPVRLTDFIIWVFFAFPGDQA